MVFDLLAAELGWPATDRFTDEKNERGAA